MRRWEADAGGVEREGDTDLCSLTSRQCVGVIDRRPSFWINPLLRIPDNMMARRPHRPFVQQETSGESSLQESLPGQERRVHSSESITAPMLPQLGNKEKRVHRWESDLGVSR